jgi:nucleoside-diphosphate-sugar epimerase
MRVLILGGTKFIGSFVTNQLVEQGHEVYVFHRGQTNRNIPENIHHLYGDRERLEDYKSLFAKVSPDVVLDMLPITEEDAKRVVDTMTGITKRIVAISSADVYLSYERLIRLKDGPIDNTPDSEEAPLRSVLYPYRKNFQPGEKRYDYDKILVEDYYMNSGLDSTILRLPMVYGPLDHQYRTYLYLKQMLDNRPYILLDEKVAAWRTCRGYVGNVAHAICLAMTNEKAANHIFNVAEEDAYSELEWANLIKQSYKKWEGEIRSIPSGKLKLDTETNYDQNLAITSSKIREILGYKEIYTVEEALQRTIKYEMENPPELLNQALFNYAEQDEVYRILT